MAVRKLNDIVPQKGKGVVVEPSPLNHIKFELGVVLCVALLILLLVPSFVSDLFSQIVILLGCGVVASLWLVLRIRRAVAQLTEQADGQDHQQ